jgi:anti-sigma factor RsiW
MLRCDQFTERVTDYLTGQIALEFRVKFSVHLHRCGNCRRYLEQMKATVNLLRQLPAPRSSTGVPKYLLARFRDRMGSPSSRAHARKGVALRLVSRH